MRAFRFLSGCSLLLVILSVLSSCNKEIPIPQTKQQTTTRTEARQLTGVMAQQSAQRTRGEAVAIAREFLQGESLNGEMLTNSNSIGVVQFDIDYLIRPKSNTAGYSQNFISNFPVDTIFYILNRKDTKGFFIISGDRRIPELIAFSDESSFDRNNVDEKSGISLFLDMLPVYYVQELGIPKLAENIIDDMQLNWKGIGSEIIFNRWQTTEKTENLIHVTWGQFYPYNKNAPWVDGKKAPAGCVATATAQFLSAFNYPTTLAGRELNWRLLKTKKTYKKYEEAEKQEFAEQVAFLFRKIGNALNNSWGAEGTGAFTSDIPEVLRGIGYQHTTDLVNYNLPLILESIKKRSPAIMSGRRKTATTTIGHAWLCDGYWKQERMVLEPLYEAKTGSKEERVLLHCNWGWDGVHNGYFLESVFDTNRPVVSDGDTDICAGNYAYNIMNIAGTRPR